MKRTDLTMLPRLTLQQATTVLRDLTGTEMPFEDLISHCRYANLDVYIHPGESEGVSSTALPSNAEVWTAVCRAAGPQLVLNPEVLLRTGAKVKLYLRGPVSTTFAEDEHQRFDDVEWELNAESDLSIITFETSSIISLAKLIDKSSTDIESRERESVLKIIAALAAICGVDIKAPYAAHVTLATAAASLGIPFEISKGTLKKYFKEADELPNK